MLRNLPLIYRLNGKIVLALDTEVLRTSLAAVTVHGADGVHFYTHTKTVTSRWPTGVRAGAEFVMPTMR